jgi:hypothetical protein
VILYHLDFSWIPGGFLGVDLFFVISGYVITRLLLDSIQRSGGLDLRAFYAARFRRLLPPLIFMVFVTTIIVGFWAPDTMRRFLGDAPFAISGAMNWWLIFRETDYFEERHVTYLQTPCGYTVLNHWQVPLLNLQQRPLLHPPHSPTPFLKRQDHCELPHEHDPTLFVLLKAAERSVLFLF